VAERTIERLVDNGFGYIETSAAQDVFIHMSAVQRVQFENLR
jgi:cold shock CspA family protein